MEGKDSRETEEQMEQNGWNGEKTTWRHTHKNKIK